METQHTCISEDLKNGVCHTCREAEARQQREVRERIRAAHLFEQVFDLTTDDTIPIL
jgi:hypothetical protein